MMLSFINEDEDDVLAVVTAASSSSSSDSDDEMMIPLIKMPCTRVLNFFEHTVENYTEEEFFENFRVTRELFNLLAAQYEVSEEYMKVNRKAQVTSAAKCMAIFLWFSANEGLVFRLISNLFNVSKSTVHSIIYRVAYFVSSLAPQFITWPSVAEMEEEAAYHRAKSGISGIIGNKL